MDSNPTIVPSEQLQQDPILALITETNLQPTVQLSQRDVNLLLGLNVSAQQEITVPENTNSNSNTVVDLTSNVATIPPVFALKSVLKTLYEINPSKQVWIQFENTTRKFMEVTSTTLGPVNKVLILQPHGISVQLINVKHLRDSIYYEDMVWIPLVYCSSVLETIRVNVYFKISELETAFSMDTIMKGVIKYATVHTRKKQ